MLKIKFVNDLGEGLPIFYPYNHLEYVGNGDYNDDLYEIDDIEYKLVIENVLDNNPAVISYKWIVS